MKVVGNSTRKHENFNGVSDKLKQELIKPLKPEQVIHFQLLNGSYDPALKREVFGASKSIRLSDRIYDPYAIEIVDEKKQTTYEGAYVDIGVPESIKDGRVDKCKKFWVNTIAPGIPGNGQFAFTGGNLTEAEIYEFLCLSNGSKTNPYRDKAYPAQYEKIDAESIREVQKEKDYKELKARLSRFTKDNPEQAATLSEFLPKEKKKEAATT